MYLEKMTDSQTKTYRNNMYRIQSVSLLKYEHDTDVFNPLDVMTPIILNHSLSDFVSQKSSLLTLSSRSEVVDDIKTTLMFLLLVILRCIFLINHSFTAICCFLCFTRDQFLPV